MCTALLWQGLSGRTLDLDRSYNEQVILTPRRFPLSFRHLSPTAAHHAMVGMAHLSGGVPLYYDAVNELGLFAAALNFPGCAHYVAPASHRPSLCSFEVIPWVLSRCANVKQAQEVLDGISLADTPFSPSLPTTPLHWFIADRKESVVLEATREGVHIWADPVGVLTNAPAFPTQLTHLDHFPTLSSLPPIRTFPTGSDAPLSGSGMGALGLPGDLSSPSRFVRCAFMADCCPAAEEETENINRFFRILDTVAQPPGCNRPDGEHSMVTRYASCCTPEGRYCYTTQEHRGICAVDLGRSVLDGRELSCFPLPSRQEIRLQN